MRVSTGLVRGQLDALQLGVQFVAPRLQYRCQIAATAPIGRERRLCALVRQRQQRIIEALQARGSGVPVDPGRLLLRQVQTERVLLQIARLFYKRDLRGDITILSVVPEQRQIDGDLQDPPALILEFVRKWEEGYRVVYGVRSSRKESWWMRFMRKLFYRMIDALSEDELPLDAGDFRLVDRRVLDELRKFEDDQPYVRGTIAALGFDQIGIPYDRAVRKYGESKFSFRELTGLAIDGILNHSVVPLRFATYLGLGISIATLFASGAYIIGRLFLGKDWPPGFATVIILILGSLSLNALFLGIIGEYLSRIYRQVKRRPLTVVECEVNPAGLRSEAKPNEIPKARSIPMR